MDISPRYLELYDSGELDKHAVALEKRLAKCDICPRECGARRLDGKIGSCNGGLLPIIASFCAHHGEEPVLSGTRGSGTIFLGNCNLRCVYCQNYQISQSPKHQQQNEVSTRVLAERMIYLQNDLECHNTNFITPSHFVPQIVRAITEAVPMGLHIPLVYNTSSYDSLQTLREIEGIFDIYLADLRYSSDNIARRYSRVRHYVQSSREAIKEMYRQVGNIQVDENGIAIKGLIIRHLVLPGDIASSEESLRWLVEEVSPEITVSIMSQYHPSYRARKYPPLDRRITPAEYEYVVNLVEELGLVNGWVQEIESHQYFLPDFRRDENPFKGEE